MSKLAERIADYLGDCDDDIGRERTAHKDREEIADNILEMVKEWLSETHR